MNDEKKEISKSAFEDCSAERVFAEMGEQITTSELRALWLRLKRELDDHGVAAATTYLGAEFTRLKEDLVQELAATDKP